MTCDPTKHFLPDYHHWVDISLRVEGAIKVPIRRVQRIAQWTGDPPFRIVTCTWAHFDEQGPLTQEKFNEDLAAAVVSLTDAINAYDEFLAYPITYQPPTTEGRAYHDWTGAAYPFDLRAIIDYDPQIPHNEDILSGLKFHLSTLISAESTINGVRPHAS